MRPEDRAICGVMAATLRRGQMLHAMSAPVTIASLVAAPALAAFAAPPLLTIDAAITFIAGLFEAFFAMRVALDADLFDDLARGRLDLDGLDAAFERMGLAAGMKSGRGLEARFQGARRLFGYQAASSLIQFAATVLIVMLIGAGALLGWRATR
jgi:hypothetical protein